MKVRVLVALLAACSVAVGQDQQPQQLRNLRQQYQKACKAALTPIQKEYLEKLDTMKKDLGGRGDIDSAKAVQDEIAAVQAEMKDRIAVVEAKFTTPTMIWPGFDWKHAWEAADPKSGTVIFKAKTTTDLIVGLADSPDKTQAYTILIGIDWNKQSWFQENAGGPNVVVSKKVIKEPTQWSTYWIRYAPSGIACGYGNNPGKDIILKYDQKLTRGINFIVFSAQGTPAEIEYVSMK